MGNLLSRAADLLKRGRSTEAGRPTIMVIGDSHVDAIKRAIKVRRMGGAETEVSAYRLSKMKNDKLIGDMSFQDCIDKIRTLGPEDIVVSAIGGNQHAVFGTIQHPTPFDFFEQGDDPVASGGAVQIVPKRMLASIFDAGIRNGDGQQLTSLRGATKARVFHLIPPPPKEDNAHILSYHETKFAEEDIVSLGVSPPALRLKFWKLQVSILKQFCGENEIEVIYPMASALTPDGYLSPDYYANDATHANGDYGELVLQHLEALANSSCALGTAS